MVDNKWDVGQKEGVCADAQGSYASTWWMGLSFPEEQNPEEEVVGLGVEGR